MKEFWKHHKLLVVGFIAACVLTSLLLVSLIADLVYWPKHRDAEMSGWMTIGYVAHSYNVEKEPLADALGVEMEIRRHLTLKSIADSEAIALPTLFEILQTAIDAERADK